MLQVVQHQKSGEILIEDFPIPKCPENGILVKTSYSLISAGTEKTSVSNAKSSLLQRARKQPEDVKLVLQFIKKEGICSTFRRVTGKLNSFKQLGYSASGTVVESQCSEFKIGDRVACGGAGIANHSEFIAIPKNLAVKLPPSVSLQSACYTTVGSIAMQGVRQADLRIGETVAIIGLGLIGQITAQLLKASGCKVIGIDINPALFPKAIECGCSEVFSSKFENISSIKAFTRGLGCDAVIITAGTSSNQPVELAMEICRKRGKVIVVGAVGMNIARNPFYQKEIDFKISCSYGPGRYDPDYEEKGIDYPAPFVRWTENRNMQSFVDLLELERINVDILTSHVYDINKAGEAYNLITGKEKTDFLGILLKYNEEYKPISRVNYLTSTKSSNKVKIGFVGLGSFAQNYLIPALKDCDVSFGGVATTSPVNVKTAAKQNNFEFCSTDGIEVINNRDVNTIFIASRHNSHSEYVIAALKANKPVFVEKPLAININELNEIVDVYNNSKTPMLMVGFNRRFSKSFKTIDKFFENRTEPLIMLYRVNAGFIPKTHWVQFPEQGGRIIGEICHFIDCMVFLTKSKPIRVFADCASGNSSEFINEDNINITIKFADGSSGVINYFANGDSSVPKEYCEVYCERATAIMNNFENVKLFRKSKEKIINTGGKKGIEEEVKATIVSIKNKTEMPISFGEIVLVTKTTFAILDSLKTGNCVQIS